MLIQKESASEFESLLLEKGFKRVNSSYHSTYPGVDNWIGFDYPTGSFIHFHVHYELVTGLEGFKNYVLPWKSIALDSRVLDDNYHIYTVKYEYELIELYTRMILKQNIVEIIKSSLFGLKVKKSNLQEYEWLKKKIDNDELRLVCEQCYPNCDIGFIVDCLQKSNLNQQEYVKLRRIIIRYFSLFDRKNERFIYFKNFLFKLKNKFKIHHNPYVISKKTSFKSGLIISFLGVDGSGKSTITEEIAKWLGWKYSVSCISLGIGREKKKKLRQLKQNLNMSGTPTKDSSSKKQSLKQAIHFYGFSSIINKDIQKISRFRSNGGIVITDRFPQISYFGVSDGPKILEKYEFLSRREKKNLEIVNQIQPDVVFKLMVPLETLLERRPNDNKELLKKKYDVLKKIHYDQSKMIDVDATVSMEEEILFIKREIWKLL